MTALFPSLSLHNGILHLDGQPRLFITADYPYYRDDARHWKERLAALKSLGVEVVTAYIPWRHHQTAPAALPDFSGHSAPNRDVLGFLSLCKELNLMAVVKPGPFIHAEVNYGGLPDWVCPLNNPAIEALLNAEGRAEIWGGARLDSDGRVEQWPLPAPLSPEFLRLSRQWLEAVGEQVIRPYQSPQGPIVAVQIGNEGLYSNGQHAPWDYDYSSSSLQYYRAFLQEKYGALDAYNRLHETRFASWQEIVPPAGPLNGRNSLSWEDWSLYQTFYFDNVLRLWREPLRTNLPILLNQNPPLDTPFGLDAWLTRVEPERWRDVHYGFTNWVGDVSAHSSAFHRYALTAKRSPGPNMEENWGFSQLYDPAYQDAAASFYQTLVALNNGATGFNVYTGIGTAYADRNVELIHSPVYPDSAPIQADGSLTPKAEIVRWLAKFFDRYGAEFLACRPVQPVAWGLYLPHARLAVWSPENDSHAPRHGKHLGEFQEQMRRLRLDYALINLETAASEDLQTYRFLFLAGGERMDAGVQRKLAEYARRGGQLVFLERIPRLDEQGEPCEFLWEMRSSLTALPAGGFESLLAGLPRPDLVGGRADIWVRSHPERDLHFVTVLIPADGETRVEAWIPIGPRRQRLTLSAAASGGALLRIENGLLAGLILKGWNAYLGSFAAPCCRLDSHEVSLEEPADLIQIGEWSASLFPEKQASPRKKS